MNPASPLNDRAYIDYLFRRTLPASKKGTPSGLVLDIGGVGQMNAARTAHLKILNINKTPMPTTDLEDFSTIPPGSVDLCVLSGVLEYFTPADAIDWLRQVRQVLKPGGWIMVAESDFESLGNLEPFHRWLSGFFTRVSTGLRLHYRSPTESLSALDEAGYCRIELLANRFVHRSGLASAFIILARNPGLGESHGAGTGIEMG
jgi:hypothetical protein